MNTKDIPLREAMFAWNWEENQNGDGVDFAVVRHPDYKSETLKLTCTHGACWAGWRDMENSKLLSITFELLWRIAAKDGPKAKDIHKAMMVVPEYREYFYAEDP